MSEHILAWHFVDSDGTRRDGVKERIGTTYHVKGELVMCGHGLHASRRCIDALQYAPGTVLRRVECWGGPVIEVSDKLVCRHRKMLWQRDVTRELHLFACRIAEDALTVAKVTDKRSWMAIEVKRAWLDSKATDAELAAAGAAAWAAAGAAAWAASAAARDAWAAWAASAAAGAAAGEKYNGWLEEAVQEEER